MMSDAERDLLNAVLANPDDDGPRLVLCDYWDERGQPERAEFVRLQIASFNDTDRYTVARRKINKVFDSVLDWMKDWKRTVAVSHEDELDETDNGLIQVIYRRGFPDEIHCTLAEFMGGECGRCGHTRGNFLTQFMVVVEHKVGFSLERCPDCKGTGRIEGIAKRIGETWPVTKVVLTDQIPNGLTDHRLVVGRKGARANGFIPAIFRDHWPQLERERDGDIFIYECQQDAVSALSQACVSYMRSLAHLPPLPGTVHQSTARAL